MGRVDTEGTLCPWRNFAVFSEDRHLCSQQKGQKGQAWLSLNLCPEHNSYGQRLVQTDKLVRPHLSPMEFSFTWMFLSPLFLAVHLGSAATDWGIGSHPFGMREARLQVRGGGGGVKHPDPLVTET